jgi:hypothetical protein
VGRVFVDTNVLFPFSVMDLMLALTEDGVHELMWSEALLAEWERVIVREQRRSAASAASVTAAIREFFPECEVPPLAARGVQVSTPDAHLCWLLRSWPEEVAAVVVRLAGEKRRPRLTCHCGNVGSLHPARGEAMRTITPETTNPTLARDRRRPHAEPLRGMTLGPVATLTSVPAFVALAGAILRLPDDDWAPSPCAPEEQRRLDVQPVMTHGSSIGVGDLAQLGQELVQARGGPTAEVAGPLVLDDGLSPAGDFLCGESSLGEDH